MHRRNFIALAGAAVAGAQERPRPRRSQTPERLPDNPTARENQLPGTQNWVLRNWELGETNTSEVIQGYASKLSVEQGGTIDLHVSVGRVRSVRSSAPQSAYMIEVYRLGYYGGAGARLMTTIGPLDGQNLQARVYRSAGGAWECDWPASHTLRIPRDWISGVYLAKVVKLAGGFESYIIFVVTEPARKAGFLLHVSDMTWHTYNTWPYATMASIYEDRVWEVALNRPYGMMTRNPPNVRQYSEVMGAGQYLHWEYPLSYFMESRGYDVAYCSQIDLHRSQELLLNHRCSISVGHDEYWSTQMYDNVKSARDKGVNLAFFSGDIMSGEIRFHDSRVNGASNRIISRHRYPGWSPEKARELSGSGGTINASGDWEVNLPDHWMFAGTGLKKGDRLINLVGWEGQDLPAAYPTLEVVGLTRVVRGNTQLTGHSTMYSVPGGAMVFCASSIYWSLGLADWPGRTVIPQIFVDERVRRITTNILDRFGKGGAA